MSDRRRFAAWVAPARARPELWRMVSGCVLTGLVWIAGLIALGTVYRMIPNSIAAGRGPLLFYLGSFALLAAGLAAVLRVLHGRGLRSLIGPGGLRPREFGGGLALLLGVGLTGAVLVAVVAPLVRQLALAEWARMLPLAIPLILVQSATEELLFRGYLMQGLAARFRSPLIWFLLPALVFGFMHWNPAEFGGAAWAVVGVTTLAGLLLADVTVRTGNLSAAMGLHFANNLQAMLLVAVPSEVSGFSLFIHDLPGARAPELLSLLALEAGLLLLLWAGWRLWRSRQARLQSPGAGAI